jgi:integrase/recombinase XerD
MLHYLEPDEVALLLRTASRSGVTGKRNAAVIALMYGCGLRVGECCWLRADGIDRERMVVYVPPEGKTGTRVQPLPEAMLKYLDAWEKVRPRYAERNPSTDAYFLSGRGNRIDRTAIYKEVRRYGAKCGMRPERVHPHAFRHSHAMALLRNPSALITDVQASMGHADLSSTMVYLHADDRRLQELYRDTF